MSANLEEVPECWTIHGIGGICPDCPDLDAEDLARLADDVGPPR